MSPLLRKISTFGIAMLASASAHAIQFDGFFTVGAAIHDDDTNKNNPVANGRENDTSAAWATAVSPRT